MFRGLIKKKNKSGTVFRDTMYTGIVQFGSQVFFKNDPVIFV